MKIGIFTDSYTPSISGVVTSINMLKDGLEALGHEVFIITTTKKHVKKSEEHIIRLKGFPFPFESLREYRFIVFPNLKVRKLKKYNFDIIHIHTEFTIGQLGLKLKKKCNIPLVYTMHTLYEDYIHHVSSFLEKHFKDEAVQIIRNTANKIIEKADVTFVPSAKILHLLKDVMHSHGEICVVPTGLELTPFYDENIKEEDIRKLKEKYGLKDNSLIWTYVGRIAPEKSIEFLIDAFADFRKTHNNAKFLIVGGGYYEYEILKYIKELKLENDCILTGYVKWEVIPMYYHIGNCFVNASITETQGLTFVEALASSCVVIARKDGAVEEIIKNGINGLIYETKEEMLEVIEKTVGDSKLVKKLKQNARLSSNPYTKEEYTKNALNIYKKLVKNKS